MILVLHVSDIMCSGYGSNGQKTDLQYSGLKSAQQTRYAHPMQFVWQELKADFFEFDAGHGYNRSMTYMFGMCVFGNSGYCQILH